MTAQSFANNAITTLTAAITTSPAPGTIEPWSVNSALLFPAVNNYTIKIDSELLLVTAGAGTTTWSMSRGAENTLPAPHLIGADVKQEWTKGGLDSLKDGYWPSLQPSGLTGAVVPTRYAGGSSGAPSTGTFAAGDFTVDPAGFIWICTAAGSPGTFKGIGSAGTVPIGAMVVYPATLSNPAWLLCDGSAFSAVTYPGLQAFLGATTVPDMRDFLPMGAGSNVALGATAGANAHTLNSAEMPVHAHSATAPGAGVPHGYGSFSPVGAVGGNNYPGLKGTNNTSNTADFYVLSGLNDIVTNNTGGGAAHSVLNPVRGVAWYIRAL